MNNKNTKIISLHSGALHWMYQLIPPLLVLFSMLLLFFFKEGPMIMLGMTVVIGAGLVSTLSVLYFLVTFKKNKFFLVRPLLSILIAVVLFPVVNYTASQAEAETQALAEKIEAECRLKNKCPQSISSIKVGGFVNYPLRYKNIGKKKFSLYFYRQLGHGTWYKSGVGESLKITYQ